MSSIVMIRRMVAEDWPDVSRIYQAGMDTNLATFQTDCPSHEEWDTYHGMPFCRGVERRRGRLGSFIACVQPTRVCRGCRGKRVY